jgi:hypothetical protein
VLYASPIHSDEGDDMRNHWDTPGTYGQVSAHFGLKWRQRDMLDTMDPEAFAEVMASFEAGDHGQAGRVLKENGVLNAS